MKKISLIDLTRQAAIASIYVVLVFIFQFISFQAIQFRIAEVLLVLIFFDKKSFIGLTAGVFIANLFSPLLIYDITFGLLATIITLSLMLLFKNKPYIALLFPALVNGIIIGLMLYFLSGDNTPFYLVFISVFLGEFAVTYIIGLPIYYLLKKGDFKRIYFIEKNNTKES